MENRRGAIAAELCLECLWSYQITPWRITGSLLLEDDIGQRGILLHVGHVPLGLWWGLELLGPKFLVQYLLPVGHHGLHIIGRVAQQISHRIIHAHDGTIASRDDNSDIVLILVEPEVLILKLCSALHTLGHTGQVISFIVVDDDMIG